MSFKLTFNRETHFTLFTHKWLLLRYRAKSLHMLIKFPPNDKSPVTFTALKILFPNIVFHQNMAAQIIPMCKSFITLITLIRLEPCMHSNMTYEIFISRKRFITLVALIWFYSSVKQPMFQLCIAQSVINFTIYFALQLSVNIFLYLKALPHMICKAIFSYDIHGFHWNIFSSLCT